MPGELTDYIAQLSPSGQLVANVAIGLGFGVLGVWQFLSQHRVAKAEKIAERDEAAGEPFDPEDLLTSSPFVRLLNAFETMAAHAVIQSEALKTISAATTVWAKTQEDDFQEWRINAAVERRWNELMRQRGSQQPPVSGWGGRGEG